MADDLNGRGEGLSPARERSEVPVAHDGDHGEVSRWQGFSGEAVRVFPRFWVAAWIILFATGNWQWALVIMFLTAPAMALVRGPRGGVRRQLHRDRHRAERRALYDRRVVERDLRRQGHEVVRSQPVPPDERVQASSPTGTTPPAAPVRAPGGAPPAPDLAAPERSLAAAVAAARTGPARVDPDALALVDELDAVLRPMLVRARQGGVDVLVRRDLESIATEHLPEALRAYQQLPPTYAHEHRAADGRTPAEELRSQLGLLVEGCAPLRDAVHGADVARQRELGRFLEAKFRRSDLDL